YVSYRIDASAVATENLASVSPDIATCSDCLRELFDAANRRYRYPYNNCANCSPRFTIIENIAYDRVRTTMHAFQMCGECKAEYENPLDRRFHAEPIACAECGPKVYLTDARRCEIGTAGEDAIAYTRRLLLQRLIVAVKGVGGFHLACNAVDAEAVGRLRLRKYREDKPFAMMARS